jgi:integration host factor subunit alpha
MNRPKFTRNDIQATLISAGIEPEQARMLTTRIIETMVTALVTGKVIELRGFGTLEPRTRKARTKHNPRTMVPVDVPARCVIFFRSGEKLKKALNGGQGKPSSAPD